MNEVDRSSEVETALKKVAEQLADVHLAIATLQKMPNLYGRMLPPSSKL